jgi:hypothetical protein
MMDSPTMRPEVTSDNIQFGHVALDRLPAAIRDHIAIQSNGCWLWTGVKLSTGYGTVRWQSKQWRAHRLVWTLTNGPIPEGLDVLHHCDTPLCVNVITCLFLGTDKDNHQDKAKKGRHWQQKKTHCPQGHAYTPENTYIPPSGGRHCCICKGISPRKVVA